MGRSDIRPQMYLGETDVGVQVSERSVQHRKKADGERRKESAALTHARVSLTAAMQIH